MKTKIIVILYASGESNAIPEEKLTEDDISLAEYLLIPIENKNRVYVCIKPHKYLKFTKAYVKYTLCAFYYNDDLSIYETDQLKPVTVETQSISDLYGLINSIDRITLVNLVLTDVWDNCNTPVYGVCDFSVTLFDEEITIYHEEYYRTGTTSIPFDAYSVTKHFKKIYDPQIITSFFMNDSYIGLVNGKRTVWEEGNRVNKYSLIGIICAVTNTIIFITQDEFTHILSMSGVTSDIMLLYTTADKDELLSEEIKNGSCNSFDDVYTFLEESFIENTMHFNNLSLPNGILNGSGPMFLELIANISFIMDTTILFTHSLYPFVSHEINEYHNPHLYDVVLKINFTKDNKSCLMNRSTILTVSDIVVLYSLKEEI